MIQARSDRFLLQTILKGVSRSFYLTVAVLPKPVRTQVGLGYLFARAADTIADTGQIEGSTRVDCLRRLKAQFVEGKINWGEVRDIQALTVPKQHHPSEQLLLKELAHCFTLYQRLTSEDQVLIARLLPTLIGGMEVDLLQFPERGESEVTALPTMADLDFYTYSVAGCVGEFWTNMMCAHLPGLIHWDQNVMVPIGIRFGKGLQLVNILKDLPRDIRQGRCYIPRELLEKVGLQPKDLLHEHNAPAIRPVFQQLVKVALDHLDQGWCYTMAIPRFEVRLRLACMWPILIGLRTLQGLMSTPNVLSPVAPVKISRGEVYRIMATTTLSGGCGYVGTAYWGYLRKRVV